MFYTAAGPEIGVASTKSFFSQMVLLLSWAGYLAQKDPKHLKQSARLFDQFIKLPHLLSSIIGEYENNSWIGNIKKVAKAVDNAKGFFFIGRGYSFPLALEGALKLKEIAYYHAEGYAGGELKHGPIAMIDEGMVLVVLVPPDTWREKTISNLQEVKARGARVIGIGDDHDSNLKSQCDYWIPTPTHLGSETIDESLFPFVLTPAIQLLSYELAVLRGTDVDQPRNLAKSVTVE